MLRSDDDPDGFDASSPQGKSDVSGCADADAVHRSRRYPGCHGYLGQSTMHRKRNCLGRQIGMCDHEDSLVVRCRSGHGDAAPARVNAGGAITEVPKPPPKASSFGDWVVGRQRQAQRGTARRSMSFSPCRDTSNPAAQRSIQAARTSRRAAAPRPVGAMLSPIACSETSTDTVSEIEATERGQSLDGLSADRDIVIGDPCRWPTPAHSDPFPACRV